MILRWYDPKECDADGVPLNWGSCRACGGSGRIPLVDEARHDTYGHADCEVCGGHGSLKAACKRIYRVPRCGDCGHPGGPMSEGIWEDGTWPQRGDGPGTHAWAWEHLRRGNEPPRNLSDDTLEHRTFAVHYSPCDGGCKHGGPWRWRTTATPPDEWRYIAESPYPHIGNETASVEASWRSVDVRYLGWPHDLRPERLAILCLRCWAAR